MTEQTSESEYIDDANVLIPGMKRFSHEAMATTFKVLIVHDDQKYARQTAAAAFEIVNNLESELSRFIPNSTISRINNLPANKPLLIGLDSFDCLELSITLFEETKGAFDVTIGPALSIWRNKDKSPRTPSEDEINLVRKQIGTSLFQLDKTKHTVELLYCPIQIDLGGIGKGYAVDKMAELFREWGIDQVLISGGFSSVLALDAPGDKKGWPLSLSNPLNRKEILSRPFLKNRAISSSGVRKGQHIIDPRTLKPVEDKHAAWSSAPNAATADALSTAFMVMSPEEIEKYCAGHPDTAAMIMLRETDQETQKEKILRFGDWEIVEQRDS